MGVKLNQQAAKIFMTGSLPITIQMKAFTKQYSFPSYSVHDIKINVAAQSLKSLHWVEIIECISEQ